MEGAEKGQMKMVTEAEAEAKLINYVGCLPIKECSREKVVCVRARRDRSQRKASKESDDGLNSGQVNY